MDFNLIIAEKGTNFDEKILPHFLAKLNKKLFNSQKIIQAFMSNNFYYNDFQPFISYKHLKNHCSNIMLFGDFVLNLRFNVLDWASNHLNAFSKPKLMEL